jgi:hypothetical protein
MVECGFGILVKSLVFLENQLKLLLTLHKHKLRVLAFFMILLIKNKLKLIRLTAEELSITNVSRSILNNRHKYCSDPLTH